MVRNDSSGEPIVGEDVGKKGLYDVGGLDRRKGYLNNGLSKAVRNTKNIRNAEGRRKVYNKIYS